MPPADLALVKLIEHACRQNILPLLSELPQDENNPDTERKAKIEAMGAGNRRADLMVRIAISVEAFGAIARTLPLGSVGYEAEANERGQRSLWLEDAMADRLAAMRGPDESYIDVIMRIAAEKATKR